MRRVIAFLLVMLIIFEGTGIADIICTEDLDQSGSIDQPNEMANCETLANGQSVCPISAVQCNAQGVEACPLPGPQVMIPKQDFLDGTLSGGFCTYDYPCKWGDQYYDLQCQLKTLPDANGGCSASHGYSFVSLPPDNVSRLQNGVCIYDTEVNGNVDPLQTISVPLFRCDISVASNVNGTDYCATCPFDARQPCAVIPALSPVDSYCSLNVCTDTTAIDPSLIPPAIADYKSAEACMGQLMIFGGRTMSCRLRGIDTSWHDCCNSDNAVTDSTGSMTSTGMALKSIPTVFRTVQAGYYGYMMYQTAISGTEMTVLESLTTDAVMHAAAAGQIGSATAGEAAVNAMGSYLQSTLLNPYTIAFAALSFVVMELLSNGCNQEDITTATLNDSGYCHYIDTDCINDSPVGCLQEADRFCCFNSKLARIVHEQGRPQLKSFQGNLWGTCRGFTPEEFEMLDFSKMDLSEYFSEVTSRAQNQIEQNINQGVQDFFNNVR